MECAEQQRLLSDEINAWAAYNALKGSTDEKELTRRSDNASDASTRLRQHISACPLCRPETNPTT